MDFAKAPAGHPKSRIVLDVGEALAGGVLDAPDLSRQRPFDLRPHLAVDGEVLGVGVELANFNHAVTPDPWAALVNAGDQHFAVTLLRALRGMTEGSSTGRRPADFCSMRFEAESMPRIVG